MLNTTNVLRKFSIKLISSFSTLLTNEATTKCELNRDKYNIRNFRGLGLKKKYLKNSICYSIIFLTFYTPVFAAPPKYYNFSTDIYDQNKILARRNLTSLTKEEKKELNEELMKELLRRKTEQLEKNFLNKIQDSIKKLHEQLEEADKGQFKKAIIEIFLSDAATHSLANEIFKDVSIGATVGATTGGLGGAAIGIAAGMVVSVARKYVAHEVTKKIACRRDTHAIIKKMDDLQEKIDELIHGLKHEPIGELEQRYVIHKRDMDPSLRAEIERSLIEARFNDYYFQLNTPAIGFALGLPLRPKPLLDRNKQDKLKRALIKRFEKDTSFSLYSEDIKKLLRGIIMQIAINSITSTSDSPLRVVEHWFGDGSTGKSTAAKKISCFLGLPYFEKRITSPDSEIRIENITGALRSIQGTHNFGWLAEALLQKVEGDDKESYLNGLLILDDFPVNMQNAQNLLLAITDPEKRSFFNQFFQADLNTSLLNIFIISNENFKSLRPEKKEDPTLRSEKAADPTFEALISRFESRRFPKFNEAQTRMIAKPYLGALVSKYKPPFFYKFKYVDPTHFEVRYNTQALKDLGFPRINHKPALISTGVDPAVTVRKLKNVLENTINYYLIELLQQSTKDFESFKKSKDVIKLRAAAFKGHPKALSELVRRKIALQKNDHQKNKETMRMVAAGHEKSGNLNEAKKWWIESFKFEGWDVWPHVSKHLPHKVERKQDRELLQHLLMFAKNHGEEHKYAAEIGNHLYLIGLHFAGSDRVESLDHSAKLGNALAIEEIEKSNRKLLLSSLPSELDDKVQKEVQMLGTLRTMIARLASDEPKIRMEGFNQLFLMDDTNEGAITNLWRTQRFTYFCGFEEINEDTGALLNRVNRFEDPSEQSSVIQFHLGLVRSLTDHLLSYRSSFYNEVYENDIIRTNLRNLRNHLSSLYSLKKKIPCEARNESGYYINDYKKWFKSGGTGRNTKADLLSRFL